MTEPDSSSAALAAQVAEAFRPLGVPVSTSWIQARGRCWRIHLVAGQRPFVVSVDHRGLSCWDVSPGREKNLISPAVGPVYGSPRELLGPVAQLIAHAVRHPEFHAGEPTVI